MPAVPFLFLQGYFQDAVRLTAVKADLGFNNGSNEAGLRPTTPDADFKINSADEPFEEYGPGPGLQWWWSRDTGSSQIELQDLEDLIPFSIDVPKVVDDSNGFYMLKLSYSGPGNITVYVYSNVSPADNSNPDVNGRTRFLSVPNVADNQLLASINPAGNGQGFLTRTTNEIYLHYFKALHEGKNEFLLRVVGDDAARASAACLHFTLEWNLGENTIPMDSVSLVVKPIDSFITEVSALGDVSSVLGVRTENRHLPFIYPAEDGQSELINMFSYRVTADHRDPDVKKTLVFLHGYNVTPTDADASFQEVYKRIYWQGFRGNFIGFKWYGDENNVAGTQLTLFDANVENALQTSPTLWSFLQNTATQSIAEGGWELAPDDIDVVSHSLGNLVMWDAMRIQEQKHPGVTLVHNMASIEAAIWSEAFAPEADISYEVHVKEHDDIPIQYTVDQLKQNSWSFAICHSAG